MGFYSGVKSGVDVRYMVLVMGLMVSVVVNLSSSVKKRQGNGSK